MTIDEIRSKLVLDPISRRPTGTFANMAYVFANADHLAGRIPSPHDAPKIEFLKIWLRQELGIRTSALLIRQLLQRMKRDAYRAPIHP